MPWQRHSDSLGSSSRIAKMVNEQWAEAGDLVAQVLTHIHDQGRAHWQQEARLRNCSLQQVAAAAITGALREYSESIHADRSNEI
jgi:hypothetical protein